MRVYALKFNANVCAQFGRFSFPILFKLFKTPKGVSVLSNIIG